MIRIDEIYDSVFWSWIKKHKKRMRMFYFWPFGCSDQNSICNYGSNFDKHYNLTKEDFLLTDNNYTIFFDQEPINLARHRSCFDKIKNQKAKDIDDRWYFETLVTNNSDINHPALQQPRPDFGILVTSEKDSDTVDQICAEYGWRSCYYFFHGWAALDWYRGYNRTYLMPEPKERTITKTFICPNRIIAGERQHRLIMLYHILGYKMLDNHISCPQVCPAENIDIMTAVDALVPAYPNIKEVFASHSFPLEFAGETGAPMHSYQLSLFTESAESLLYLVTETVATGRRLHLTEKTFKPICLRMPFMIVGTAGSLAYLRSYGFRTFGDLWDESYDDEINDHQRLEKIASTLKALDILPPQEKQRLFDMAQEICEHNYNHFYSGGFEQILEQELEDMLNDL